MVSFGQVARGAGIDHLRPHLPSPQGIGRVSHGLGVNLQRPHLAGPQHYQPPPLIPHHEEEAANATSESSNVGEGSP